MVLIPAHSSLEFGTTDVEFTLMADIYPSEAGQSSVSQIVAKLAGVTGGGGQEFALQWSPDRQVRLRVNGVNDFIPSAQLELNQWYRVIARFVRWKP